MFFPYTFCCLCFFPFVPRLLGFTLYCCLLLTGSVVITCPLPQFFLPPTHKFTHSSYHRFTRAALFSRLPCGRFFLLTTRFDDSPTLPPGARLPPTTLPPVALPLFYDSSTVRLQCAPVSTTYHHRRARRMRDRRARAAFCLHRRTAFPFTAEHPAPYYGSLRLPPRCYHTYTRQRTHCADIVWFVGCVAFVALPCACGAYLRKTTRSYT